MSKLDPDTFITIDEAAAYARVVPRTIDRWAKQGMLTKFHAGPKAVRFRASELQDYIAKVSRSSTPAVTLPTAAPATTPAPHFQSPGSVLAYPVGGMTANEADELYKLFVKHGFAGVTLLLAHDHLFIMWPDVLGYSEELFDRKLSKAVRKGERYQAAE